MIFLGVMTTLMFSCNTTKNATGTKAKKLTSSQLAEKVISHNLAYDYFSGKAKVRVSQNGESLGGTMQLRMKRDQYVWISVQKLGFEVARCFVRKDSAFVINRLQRVYYAERLDDYLQQYQIPFGLTQLQDLLVGNTVVLSSSRPKSGRSEEGNQVLMVEDETSWSGEYQFDAITLQLMQALIQDPTGRSINANYIEYDDAGQGQITPHHFSIEVQDESESAGIEMNYNEIEIDSEKNIPFAIPSHYTRVR